MYTAKLSIKNLSDSPDDAFNHASKVFLDGLSSIPDSEMIIPNQKIEGTRGDMIVLTGIIVTGGIGLFTAIYTLTRDLFTYYSNAEVELQFRDGSKLNLKNLFPGDAERIIREHLEKAHIS